MPKDVKQNTMFGTHDFPTSEEILDQYAKEFNRHVAPRGKNTFGFWMQTLADLELLDLELEGLTKSYKINSSKRNVTLNGDNDFVRSRIAHLEKVDGKDTLYTHFVDMFGDTNAYAFHNLYPYKGKFYPRVVRTLINYFKLKKGSILLDPFNGSGTATHEASLMGIKCVGIDVTPMGTLLATLKNDLPFLHQNELDFKEKEVVEILQQIEKKKWKHSNKTIYNLMLTIYFDTVDAFTRTSRYNKKGKYGLFLEKVRYIKNCYEKLNMLKDEHNLEFKKAKIVETDILELDIIKSYENKFDAIITSPPYYFSIDYVGKDRIAYEYLGTDMQAVEAKYLGMKNTYPREKKRGDLPHKVLCYYEDLRKSIENMHWALKKDGKLAIIVGDSTVSGKKIPTTMMTKEFCEEIGFKFKKLIFNPLLGARNRAIRGESIILCSKK